MKKDYYIFKGEQLSRRNDTIRLYYEGGDFKDLPINKVESLHVFNEMTFNCSFINFINKKNITVHFYNYYGYYTGSLYPKESNISGNLLTKQVLASLNTGKKMYIAKNFLLGATHNMLRNLKYYKNRGRDIGDIELAHIQALQKKLTLASSINELMGLEGNIRREYYKHWDKIVNNVFQFEKRTRMPPENHLNTLISFGNSLCYTACLSEIYKTHLEPSISFLHASSRK